jgi:uncharacterized protein YdhG (YjbR/CyaY superfamily)
MAELKTKPTNVSVKQFIDAIGDEQKRKDARKLAAMLKKHTRAQPRMWGGSIVGFGSYHYKYPSGHEGDTCLAGFSPRKAALTLYLTPGIARYGALLAKLGKHKTGKGCLYINKLADVDEAVLDELIARAVADTRKLYGA